MTNPRFFLFLAIGALIIACNPAKTSTKSPTYTDATATPFRKKVIDYGQKFIGTDYKYAGTSPKTGFDCSGFTSYVLKQNGVTASPAYL